MVFLVLLPFLLGTFGLAWVLEHFPIRHLNNPLLKRGVIFVLISVPIELIILEATRPLKAFQEMPFVLLALLYGVLLLIVSLLCYWLIRHMKR